MNTTDHRAGIVVFVFVLLVAAVGAFLWEYSGRGGELQRSTENSADAGRDSAGEVRRKNSDAATLNEDHSVGERRDQESMGVVEGLVLQQEGNPVSGAQIRIYRREPVNHLVPLMLRRRSLTELPQVVAAGISDAAGFYRLEVPINTNLCAQVQADGLSTASKDDFRVESNMPYKLDFRLSRGSTLRGVIRELDGKVVADRQVTLLEFDPSAGRVLPGLMTRTDADGRFHCTSLAEDPRSVLQLVVDFGDGAKYWTLLANVTSVREFEIVLSRTAQISGRITDEKNSGVSGADVRCSLETTEGRWDVSTRSDGEGFYGLPSLSPGKVVTFQVEAAGYAPFHELPPFKETTDSESFDRHIRRGDNRRPVRLERPRILSGRVREIETGAPIEGVDLALVIDFEQPERTQHTRTRVDGTFDLPVGMAEGLVLAAWKEGYESVPPFYDRYLLRGGAATLGEDSRRVIPDNLGPSSPAMELKMRRMPEILVKFQDEAGQALAGVLVRSERRFTSPDLSQGRMAELLGLAPSQLVSNQQGEVRWARLSGLDRIVLSAGLRGFVTRAGEIDVSSATHHVLVLERGGVVFGVVRGADGAPLAGALVRMDIEELKSVESLDSADVAVDGTSDEPFESRSDEHGKYSLIGLPACTLTLLASHQDHPGLVLRPLELGRGERLVQDLVLPQPFFLSGRVVDRDGRGISGATVEAVQTDVPSATTGDHPDNDISVHRVQTADNGTFRFSRLRTGKYEIRAMAAGFQPASGEFASGTEQVNLVLEPTLMIAGRVVLPNDDPELWMVMAAPADGGGGTASATLGETGQFELKGLIHTDYTLAVIRRFEDPKGEINLAPSILSPVAAGTRDLLISVNEGVRLQVQVLLNGEPLSGVEVRLQEMEAVPGFGQSAKVQTSDSEGRTTFSGLRSVHQLLQVQHEDNPEKIETLSPGTTECLLELESGARITARILDESGAVVVAGHGTLSGKNLPSRTMAVEADGRLNFRGLAPGRYRLKVFAPLDQKMRLATSTEFELNRNQVVDLGDLIVR